MHFFLFFLSLLILALDLLLEMESHFFFFPSVFISLICLHYCCMYFHSLMMKELKLSMLVI